MTELARWLREQMDEDERITRAASGEEWGAVEPSQPYVVFDVAAYRARKTMTTVGAVAGVEREQDRVHIVEWDPARVLREIDAKRRTLERHQPHSMGKCRVCEAPHWGVLVCDHCYGRKWPCPDVLDLLSIYSDRPGYADMRASID